MLFGIATPYDFAEDQVEFFCFLPLGGGVFAQTWLGSGDQSKPVFGFLGFLLADANLVTKVLFRFGIIGFTVVCANARARLDELANQNLIDGRIGDSLGQKNHLLGKFCRTLVQIKFGRLRIDRDT